MLKVKKDLRVFRIPFFTLCESNVLLFYIMLLKEFTHWMESE